MRLPPCNTGISRETFCTRFAVLANKSSLEQQRKSHPGAKAMKQGPVGSLRVRPQPQPLCGAERGSVPERLEKTWAALSTRGCDGHVSGLSSSPSTGLQKPPAQPHPAANPAPREGAFWAGTAAFGGHPGGWEGKNLPSRLPPPLHGGLMAASAHAALMGFPTASHAPHQCRGCLLLSFP